MKRKIRKLLFEIEPSVIISVERFAEWLSILRKQENLFYKKSSEDHEQYKYSADFIKELFWQIVCLKYLYSLGILINEENLESIEKLIREYDDVASIQILMPSLLVSAKEVSLSAWKVLKEIDALVNGLDSFSENTEDAQNFLYMIRHNTGHDVRGKLNRFASNLSSDLKV